MEASSAVVLFSAPCQVMVRSGLGCARCRSPRALPALSFPRPSASQQPELSAGMVLPFSWSLSSPEGGKLHTSGFFHCCHHLLSPSIAHRCLARSAGAVVAHKDSRVQGARLGSHLPTERDQRNLSCVTFQPGACHSLGKKGSDQKGSLCSAKINVSYFCLAVALYSNYINYS